MDIGLDDEPIADAVLAAEVLADADDGQRHLVAQHDRLGHHVAADAGVIRALLDHLDVGKTEAVGIVAHQQLVGTAGRDGRVDRLAFAAHVLHACAVERPQAVRRFDGVNPLSVGFELV